MKIIKIIILFTGISLFFISDNKIALCKEAAMDQTRWHIYYVGSSESFTIFSNREKNSFILQVSTPFETRRYLLMEKLRARLLKGGNIIDDVRNIIKNDQEYISSGKIKVLDLPGDMFETLIP